MTSRRRRGPGSPAGRSGISEGRGGCGRASELSEQVYRNAYIRGDPERYSRLRLGPENRGRDPIGRRRISQKLMHTWWGDWSRWESGFGAFTYCIAKLSGLHRINWLLVRNPCFVSAAAMLSSLCEACKQYFLRVDMFQIRRLATSVGYLQNLPQTSARMHLAPSTLIVITK